MSATSASAMSGPATAVGGGASGSGAASSQSGPPYLCPTCGTNYSRLEYLRRHERRHADIRPFVCDCGKGFSRSDVLSRHKRQCAVVLNGGEEGGVSGDLSLASNKSANGKRASTGGAGARRKNSSAGRNSVGGARESRKGGRSDALNGTPDDDDDDDDGEEGPGASYPVHRHHRNSNADQRSAPFVRPGATTHLQQQPAGASTGSFPFPPQPGVHQIQSGGPAPPPLLPPAPFGSDVGLLGNAGPGGPPNNAPFGNVLPHHMTAFNSLVNQQHNYPSSPESNGTMSQHGSPRFAARDMARHGSNGSRTFSLRKGGSFDHIGPRNAGNTISGTTPNQYAPEFWDALDPAAKTVGSMAGSDYISAGAAIGMADAGNGGTGLSGGGIGGGLNGVTTPRGEPQRFAVSTGPLSPFSSIALTSTMSPYLSAFSNARDTPFVASPSRGMIPGTPGSSLNVFDWTMRPPSKPASSSMAKRDSLSHNNGSASTGVNGAQSGSSTTSPTGNKRKREEDEASRKSPRIEEIGDVNSLDDEHRSAAELLDSLRNSGTRQPQTPGATDASTISTSAASIPASVSAADLAADALAAVSAAADVATISAISQGISMPNNDAPVDYSAAAKTRNSISFFDHKNVTPAPSNEVRGGNDKGEGLHPTSSNGGHGRLTSAPDDLADKSRPRSDSPPRQNLTLSQLPASQAPTSAAGLAQSSWEAIMQNNNRWGGDGVEHGDDMKPASSDAPPAADATSSAKLTATQQQHAAVVGEEMRSG